MLDPKNNAKVSEKDYDYQIWLPLFGKLFNINKNVVRIKTGETVPENTTEAKAALYHNHGNIIGFKTDIRGILDFDEEEFDLICGEGCLYGATNDKIGSDISKLVREEKEAQTAVQNIYDSTKALSKSTVWLCQFIGLHCKISSIHATKHGYHVNVPECSITFPTSFFDSDDTNAIANLFTFRDSVEKNAVDLQRILEKNKQELCAARNENGDFPDSPERSTVSLEPTWHTPPRSDRTLSRIPAHMIYESGIESDNDNGDNNNQQVKADDHGFVKTKSGWLDVTNNKEYVFHPYHI